MEAVFAKRTHYKKASYIIGLFSAGSLEHFVILLHFEKTKFLADWCSELFTFASGQANKAKPLCHFFLLQLYSNLGSPCILGSSVNACFHLSLLSASLGDSDGASTLHLGAER